MMGRCRLAKNRDDDLESKSGDLKDAGEKKEQLAKKPDNPLEGMADVSLSPIDTW